MNLSRHLAEADWPRTLRGVWSTMTRSEIGAHCASVGFFGLLSVFPVMAVFVLIYGLAFSASEMESQVLALRPFVPGVAYELLDNRLKELASHPASHLTAGLIFTTLVALYMGSRGVRYLISLLNVAYREVSSRGALRRTLLAVALTLGALVILVLCLATLAVAPLLRTRERIVDSEQAERPRRAREQTGRSTAPASLSAPGIAADPIAPGNARLRTALGPHAPPFTALSSPASPPR